MALHAATAAAAIHETVSFERLVAFEVDWEEPLVYDPEVPPTAALPANVRRMHARTIEIEGYMTPLDWTPDGDQDRVERFLFTPNPVGCCVVHLPQMKDMVEVVMPEGETAEYVPLAPATVRGTFEVREKIDEDGYVLALFRIRATSVRRSRAY